MKKADISDKKISQKTAALHNLGCKVNAYETEAMQEILENAGYTVVPFSEKADVYVINTCTVTAVADQKSRQMLHRARSLNPDAVIVAAGCYVQTDKKKCIEEVADVIIGNNRKSELVHEIEKFLESRRQERNVTDINHIESEYEDMHLSKTSEHTRAFIKVQDGCNRFCSYCLIPYARGRIRSRSIDSALSEIRGLADTGYKEVVLTGIHLSSYGLDPESAGKETLIDLIEAVSKIPGIERIRLGSFEPMIIKEDFVKRLSAVEKICPHFHLSLQSGCDATLKRMNRQYTTEEYAHSVNLLRKYFDSPAITTDVITGFPGETEEEFAETVEFLKKIAFYEIHVFPYSKREGTKAAAMKGQLPKAVKKERSNVLLSLTAEDSKKYRASFIDHEVSVLLEEPLTIDGENYMTGYTPEYVKVAVKKEALSPNTVIKGTVKGFLSDDLMLLNDL